MIISERKKESYHELFEEVNYQNNEMESFNIPFGSNEFVQAINPDVANFNIIDQLTFKS